MQRGKDQVWRSASVVVRSEDGRMSADIRDVTAALSLNTVAEAMPFIESALGRDVVTPPVALDSEVTYAYAWTFNGKPQVGFDMMLPGLTGRGYERTMGFGFGAGLDFSLGCGGEFDPFDVDLGGTPGVMDSTTGTSQVIWPATLDDRNATYSVHGNYVPKEEVLEIARTMAVSQP
jgi:hypothetical protein